MTPFVRTGAVIAFWTCCAIAGAAFGALFMVGYLNSSALLPIVAVIGVAAVGSMAYGAAANLWDSLP